MDNDIIFSPLEFRNLTVKNRLFRSNISGRWDNYDGSGSYVRINWEERFARGGFGTIISSFVPVHVQGRIVPGYAMIDDDEIAVPDWLFNLMRTQRTFDADVVFGPVHPEFDTPSDKDEDFLTTFYTYSLPLTTGSKVGVRATNNALIRRSLISGVSPTASVNPSRTSTGAPSLGRGYSRSAARRIVARSRGSSDSESARSIAAARPR